MGNLPYMDNHTGSWFYILERMQMLDTRNCSHKATVIASSYTVFYWKLENILHNYTVHVLNRVYLHWNVIKFATFTRLV